MLSIINNNKSSNNWLPESANNSTNYESNKIRPKDTKQISEYTEKNQLRERL